MTPNPWINFRSRLDAAYRRLRGAFPPHALSLAGNALLLALLIAAVAIAWLAQARIDFKVTADATPWGRGMIPPQVLEIWGSATHRWITRQPAGTNAAIYLGVVALFGVLSLLVSRSRTSPPAIRPIHLEPERECLVRQPVEPMLRWRYGALSAFAAFIAAACFVTAMACSRAKQFSLESLNGFDRFLKTFFNALGWEARPNWWIGAVAWIAIYPAGVAAIWLGGRALGYAWKRSAEAKSHRRLWEWVVVAAVCIAAGIGYNYRLRELPFYVLMDEGAVGRLGYELVRDGSQRNFFDDPIIPNPGFVTRGLSAKYGGMSFEDGRRVSALTGAAGLIVVYLVLRTLFSAGAALCGMLLCGAAHVVIQYSRIGYSNIDTVYWLFLMFLAYYHAELAPPGPSRLGLSFLAGGMAGACFGLYPGAVIGVVILLAMVVVRALSQPDFLQSRIWAVVIMLVGFGLAVAPIKLIPGYAHDRAVHTSLLETRVLTHVLNTSNSNGMHDFVSIIAARFKAAMGVFHYRSDQSFGYLSLVPLAGPLTAALAALGGGALLIRYRSWLTYFVWGLFFFGCMLGGAIRHSPDPPASARLLPLVLSLILAASFALELIFRQAGVVLRGIAGLGRFGKPAAGIFAAVLLSALGLALAIETKTNVDIWRANINDPYIGDKYFLMSAETQLTRFLCSHAPRPNYVFRCFKKQNFEMPGDSLMLCFGDIVRAVETVEDVNGVNLNKVWEQSQIMFIFDRSETSKLETIRTRFPGGRTIEVPDYNRYGTRLQFVVYEFYFVKMTQFQARPSLPTEPLAVPSEAVGRAVPGFGQVIEASEEYANALMFNKLTPPMAVGRNIPPTSDHRLRWLTQAVTDDPHRPIIFAGSFEDKPGLRLKLSVEGRPVLEFEPKAEWKAQAWSKGGLELHYFPREIESGCRGIFMLKVPPSMQTPGEPLELTVQVLEGPNAISWFGVYDIEFEKDFSW